MTAVNWKRAEILRIEDQDFRFLGRSKLGHVNLEHAIDGYIVSKTDQELVSLWNDGKLIRVHANDNDKRVANENVLIEGNFGSLPEHVRHDAVRKTAYVKKVIDENPRYYTEECLDPIIVRVAEEIGDANPPTARTLSDWCAQYRRSSAESQGIYRALAPQYHRRGDRRPRFAPEVANAMMELVDRYYLCRTPLPVKSIHEELRRIVGNMRVLGQPDKRFLTADGTKYRYPSLTTLRVYVRSIPVDDVIRSQRGAVEARRRCDPVIRGPQGERPMGEVEGDHKRLDVIALDDDRVTVLGQPWLTAFMCRRTRMITGFYIGFKFPSVHTVALALKHTIEPKDEDLEQYPEITEPYPCYGIPETLVVDNGPEFDSDDFLNACFGLGIDVIRCQVRTPQQKGKIERFFKRLDQEVIHRLPGTTFSNRQQRGDYKSEDKAVCTLSDLRKIIMTWLVMDYSRTHHLGLGEIPVEKWNKEVESSPVRLPDDVRKLDTLLTISEERALTRKGIELYGLRYNSKSPEFKAILNRPDKPAKVRVVVNPDDLNSILVEDWRYNTYFRLPSINPEYTEGLTLAVHEILTARAKINLEPYKRVTVSALIGERHKFRETVKELERLKRKAMRTAAATGDNEREAGGTRINLDNVPATDFSDAPLISKTTEPKKYDYANDDEQADLVAKASALGIRKTTANS